MDTETPCHRREEFSLDLNCASCSGHAAHASVTLEHWSITVRASVQHNILMQGITVVASEQTDLTLELDKQNISAVQLCDVSPVYSARSAVRLEVLCDERTLTLGR